MKIILGEINFESCYSQNNVRSKHCVDREDEFSLSIESRLVKCYKVLNNNSIQVHYIYEDGSLYIFNEDSKVIITLILLEPKELKKYLSFSKENPGEYVTLSRSCRLHRELKRRGNEEVLTRKKKLIKKSSLNENNESQLDLLNY